MSFGQYEKEERDLVLFLGQIEANAGLDHR